MSLYHWINLLSISVPFLAGFHPRIRLYRDWPALFTAIGISMVPYIIWDAYFTIQGYWGFNPDYLGGISILELPLEEWLFFVCIPYACVFTHVSILEINPNLKLSLSSTRIISIALLGLMFVVLIFNLDKAYTSIDMLFSVIILLAVYFLDAELLRNFYITFLFMLIPFFLVNGILTGSGIENEVVWYNNEENLGIRLWTIPVEDIGYAFSLILLNLFLFKKIQTSH